MSIEEYAQNYVEVDDNLPVISGSESLSEDHVSAALTPDISLKVN